jgi:acyl-CoA thioesterase FadM
VTIRIAAITRKTIRYSCVLTKDDVTLATGSMTVICVRNEPNEPIKAMNIPAEIAARFAVAAGEQGASDAAAADAAAAAAHAGTRV